MLLVGFEEQKKLYIKIEKQLAEAAGEVHKNWSCERSGYAFDNYVIWLYPSRSKWLGLMLEDLANSGSDRNLQFSTYSPKSGVGQCAAAFFNKEKSLFLLHDGRVYPRDGRISPKSETPVKIEKKNYFVVTDFNSDNFIEGIIKFQRSRNNPNLGLNDLPKQGPFTADFPGVDTGSTESGKRKAAEFTARHAPIVKALLDLLIFKGFKLCCSKLVRPDLLLERRDIKILIEIKPDADFNSMCAAIGQVICYSDSNLPNRKFIVSPKLDKNNLNFSTIQNVMRGNKIEHFSFEWIGGKLSFPELPNVLLEAPHD